MRNLLDYTPSGTVEEAQMISWTVDTKQPFPIQGPFYDLAGYLFKPTLKRLSSNGPLNLEIELMSSVGAQTPLQVDVAVETMAPPSEKSLTHSFQRRSAALSDRNRTIEVKTVMPHDRWEISKGLRIEFKFDPIQRQKPRYDWLWNSQSTKDVEIRFSDPQLAPILVHKDLIREGCPKFINLVQVVNPNDNVGIDGATEAMAQGQGPTPPFARSSHPESPTSISSSVLTPQMNPAAQEHQRPGQEMNLMSMSDSSNVSSLYHSMTGSFVNVSRDPSLFLSSKDDLSMTDSDRSHELPKRSEDTLFEEVDAGERRPLLSQARAANSGLQHQQQQHQNQSGNGGLDSDQHQEKGGKGNNNRKTARAAKNLEKQQNSAAASGAMSPVNVRYATREDDQRERKMEQFTQEQEAKRQTHQQEREKSPHSPLTHISHCSKSLSPPAYHQRQMQHLQIQQQSTPGHSASARRLEREIWQWPPNMHAEVCTILLRWIYFEEVPTHHSGSNYPLNVIELLLDTFQRLDLQILFQRFLSTQLHLIEQHTNPMSFWKSPELAKPNGMVNRFFRPVIVKTSAQNLRTIVWSQEFGNVLVPVDPSGVFREALARQPSPFSRQ
ncbi:hypothetical protein BGZ47_010325 [Haplosporangium gracile]|nr:hypothetical protein BGZ47_010325 [Haplosporangium gracile]